MRREKLDLLVCKTSETTDYYCSLDVHSQTQKTTVLFTELEVPEHDSVWFVGPRYLNICRLITELLFLLWTADPTLLCLGLGVLSRIDQLLVEDS